MSQQPHLRVVGRQPSGQARTYRLETPREPIRGPRRLDVKEKAHA